MLKFISIFICWLSVSIALHGQGLVTGFTAQQATNGVYLTFTLVKGNTCLDTEILRSADGVNFETVGIISGVCGSVTENVSYDFTDEKPLLNRDNYYQIFLRGLGYSEIIRITYYNYNNENIIALYDYQNNNCTIAINKTNVTNGIANLYDVNGNLIRSISVSEKVFTFDIATFANQIYFLEVIADNKRFLKKLVIHN